MRLIIIFINLLFISNNSVIANDLIQEGSLVCTNTHNTVDTTVVFLNGIKNDLDAAEESRKKLEELLKENNICDGETCAVEKFYNKTDESFGLNDANELKVVAKFEDYANRMANIELLKAILNDYLIYIKSHVNDPYIPKIDYITNKINMLRNDTKIEDHILDVIPAYETSSANMLQIIKTEMFSLFGTGIDVRDYENKYFKSGQFSYYTYLIVFKNAYKKYLAEKYLSNREFYKDDSNAKQAITRTIEGLVSYLEERYLQGQKLVVVAHSQGNHMIELAHSILSKKYTHFSDAIRVVGVASVAHTTPNGCYITNTDDTAVDTGQSVLSTIQPLIANFEINGIHFLGLFHSFLDVYLNKDYKGTYFGSDCLGKTEDTNLQEILMKLIKNQKDSAIANTNQIQEHSILTASLRWEKNYDDMDLYTKEPNGVLVYYDNQRGKYGSLDRDDTDYEGPEHYSLYGISTENMCSFIPLEGATWKFGIQQYSNGGHKSIAHLQIKIGDDSVAHKSYDIDSWPSSIQWLATVTFKEHSENAQKVDYSIKLDDQSKIQ